MNKAEGKILRSYLLHYGESPTPNLSYAGFNLVPRGNLLALWKGEHTVEVIFVAIILLCCCDKPHMEVQNSPMQSAHGVHGISARMLATNGGFAKSTGE